MIEMAGRGSRFWEKTCGEQKISIIMNTLEDLSGVSEKYILA
jgi:hypothetical protein